MVTVLLPMYVLLITLAPWFVRAVLGERWRGTEPLIQLLGLVGLVGLFGEVCVPLFRGLGHPKWVVVLELVQSGLVVALLWAAIGRYDAVGAALAWLTGTAVSHLLHYWVARRLLENPLAGLWLPAALVSTASLVGAAVVVALWQFLDGPAGFAVAGAPRVDHDSNSRLDVRSSVQSGPRIGVDPDVPKVCSAHERGGRTVTRRRNHPRSACPWTLVGNYVYRVHHP